MLVFILGMESVWVGRRGLYNVPRRLKRIGKMRLVKVYRLGGEGEGQNKERNS